MRTPATIAALLTAGALAVAGCGGTTTITVTATDDADTTADTITDAPSANTTTEPPSDSINDAATNAQVGGPSKKDGSLEFRVPSIEVTTQRVPSKEYAADENIVPTDGAKLVVVNVTAKNIGQLPIMPFCGGLGTVLIDAGNRNFKPDDRQLSIAGNEQLCDDLQPGFRSDYRLLFQVPKDAKIVAVALWDSDESGDFNGNTSWIRFAR